MMKVNLLILTVFIFCIGAKAWAGEFLSPQELTKRSEAIAVVDVNLQSNEVKVIEWLMTTQQGKYPKIETKQVDSLSTSHCLPNRDGIKRWIHRFGQSKSRKQAQRLWKKSLKNGNYRSIVFLKWSMAKSRLVATCETEVIEVKQWQIHPQFDQFKTLIQKLILARKNQAK